MKQINKYYTTSLILILIVSGFFLLEGLYKNIKIKYTNHNTTEFSLAISSVPRIVKYVAPPEPPIVHMRYPNSLNVDAPVLNVLEGNISHYGPDCQGCGGYTATGKNVSNGNIYHYDPTFGEVFIVAADSSLPFGSIVRLNIPGSTKIAIVLDRGGGIGFGRRFLFDLLSYNERTAAQYGVNYNVKVDILRYGY